MMPSASDLLERLESLGIEVTVSEGYLVLRPARLVPKNLVPEITDCKGGLIRALRSSRIYQKAVGSKDSEAVPPRVLVGPWQPVTIKQKAEERRRVLEEEPHQWWWHPRYRLADLERDGVDRAEAVSQVRAEYEVMP